MTRFVMTLDEAVHLCLHAFTNGENGDLFVQKAPAATIADLVKAVLMIMDRPNHPVKVIGTRHGEKQFETLLSREEMAVATQQNGFYRVVLDQRDLNYDAYFREGEERVSQMEDFNSANTRRLTAGEVADLLSGLPYVQSFIDGRADAA